MRGKRVFYRRLVVDVRRKLTSFGAWCLQARVARLIQETEILWDSLRRVPGVAIEILYDSLATVVLGKGRDLI